MTLRGGWRARAATLLPPPAVGRTFTENDNAKKST